MKVGRTLAVGDGVVPDTSVETDQRLGQLIVKHLEPHVARNYHKGVVHHVARAQLTVVWNRQLRTVHHCKIAQSLSQNLTTAT